MRIQIDPESPDHPYVQLAGQLRAAIKSGAIGPVVPSIMKLAEETGLAPNTIRRALEVLRGEELIYTVQGRGTFARRR